MADWEIKNCRGSKVRDEILKNYKLKPICHLKLLPGQKKQSLAGDELTDRYYTFAYETIHLSDPKTGKPYQSGFNCGYHVAESFLSKLGLPHLTLFNPIHTLGTSGTGGSSGGAHHPTSSSTPWCPINLEMLDAIHLICTCWSRPPRAGSAMSEISDQIRRFPHSPVFDSKVASINTIISHDANKRTLVGMINELRAICPNLKVFNFPEMKDALKRLQDSDIRKGSSPRIDYIG